MLKTFCITLKTTPARTLLAKQHLDLSLPEYTFFNGFDNRLFKLEGQYRDGNTMPLGHVGCLLSHYMLWNMCDYLSEYDEFLVLEDDVSLVDDFWNKFTEMKKHLPEDWQFLYLGYCCFNPKNTIEVNDFVITSPIPPLCTHAYLFKREALKTIIETNMKAENHVDVQLQWFTVPKLKYYMCFPQLAGQHSLYNPNGLYKSLTLA